MRWAVTVWNVKCGTRYQIRCCQLEKDEVMPSWIQGNDEMPVRSSGYSTSQKIRWCPSENPHCSRALALLGRAVSILSWPAGVTNTHLIHTKMSFWMLSYGNSLELPKVGVKNNNQSLDCIFCLHSAWTSCLRMSCDIGFLDGSRCKMIYNMCPSCLTLWPCGFHL